MARLAPPITPEDLAKYEAASRKCLEDTKAMLDAPDWKEKKKDRGVVFCTRSVPGSRFNAVKSVTMVPRSMRAVVDNLSEMAELEPDMPADVRDGAHQRHMHVTAPNSFNDGYVYIALETPTRIVSPRDFLLRRQHFEEGGTHYFTQISIVNDAIQAPVKGFVRGVMMLTFVCEQVGDNVRTTFQVHAARAARCRARSTTSSQPARATP